MLLDGSAQRVLSAIGRSTRLSCRAQRSLPRPAFLASKAFSTTARRNADDPTGNLGNALAQSMPGQRQTDFRASEYMGKTTDPRPGEIGLITSDPEPHHLCILCSGNNTHITLTRPNRNIMISLTTGNLGFRKAGRGSYDAAYQLSAFMLSTIQERGLLVEIKNLELIFSGYGDGREAVKKAIMGAEGIMIRKKIVRITDATKLKFGGSRSRKPRRLG